MFFLLTSNRRSVNMNEINANTISAAKVLVRFQFDGEIYTKKESNSNT